MFFKRYADILNMFLTNTFTLQRLLDHDKVLYILISILLLLTVKYIYQKYTFKHVINNYDKNIYDLHDFNTNNFQVHLPHEIRPYTNLRSNEYKQPDQAFWELDARRNTQYFM